jgi:hypothetical protein
MVSTAAAAMVAQFDAALIASDFAKNLNVQLVVRRELCARSGVTLVQPASSVA